MKDLLWQVWCNKNADIGFEFKDSKTKILLSDVKVNYSSKETNPGRNILVMLVADILEKKMRSKIKGICQ